MLSLPELLGKCRRQGVRLTPQRIAIFEILAAHGGHPTAEEIYQQILRQHPTTSFATVYNTLELLTRMGEIREVVVDELRRRYDPNTGPHSHAVCRRCRRILDIPPEITGSLTSSLQTTDLTRFDFAVESTTLEFSGLCGGCSRAS